MEAGWTGVNNGQFYMEYETVFDESIIRYRNGQFSIYNKNKNQFKSIDYSQASGHLDELQYFVECIKNNRKPEICSPESSRDTVALAILEKQSLNKKENKRTRTGFYYIKKPRRSDIL